MCAIKIIEYINFNDRLPSNHSFCTTAVDGQYLSVYDTSTNTIYKDRKKYFLNDLLSRAIDAQETLYTKFKKTFTNDKKQQIEDGISALKRIRDSDFNNKMLLEITKKLNLLSYNKRTMIQGTWNNILKGDEEDDHNFLNELNIPTATMPTDPIMLQFLQELEAEDVLEYSDESEDEKHQLIPTKCIKIKKPNHIEL
jgi:hypothetical protein